MSNFTYDKPEFVMATLGTCGRSLAQLARKLNLTGEMPDLIIEFAADGVFFDVTYT